MVLADMMNMTGLNDECVLFEFKKSVTAKDKIMTGLFDGKETMIRVTRSEYRDYTVFYDNGKCFHWHYGPDGYTLVSNRVRQLQRMIDAQCRANGIYGW